MAQDIRWKQRLQNFEKAFFLLKSALEKSPKQLSDLEKEGVIQRFEYTFELAWKTMKDYLVYSGVSLEQITPRQVIKQAFAAKVIVEGQLWIEMLEHRNLMSHTYDEAVFAKAAEQIASSYLKLFNELYLFLKEKSGA